ncbi:Protein kinase-like domain superfamily [Sesbania bispinosa]|nr:Protein kinase-like domain superfamily [Sesbania bispinosa]
MAILPALLLVIHVNGHRLHRCSKPHLPLRGSHRCTVLRVVHRPMIQTSGGSPCTVVGPMQNQGILLPAPLKGIIQENILAILSLRRKKAKGDVYGADGNYYVQQPSLGRNYGSGKIGGSMKHLGGPLESAQPKSAQVAFSYDMVMEITNSFCNENVIGEGGFRCVYKGWLTGGKAVAVK